MSLLTHASEPKQYQIAAYNNCQLMTVIPMTAEQNKTYQQFKEFEQKMALHEAPMEVFEAQMEILGEQMEQITKSAIIEENNILTINKTLLEEQETIAEQIQALVDEYQPEITRLEQAGDEISKIADQFEQTLPDDIKSHQYDMVDIIPLTSVPKDHYCGYKS
jgi:DNA repair ATPase RecN